MRAWKEFLVRCHSSGIVTTRNILKSMSMMSCQSERSSSVWNSCRNVAKERRKKRTSMPQRWLIRCLTWSSWAWKVFWCCYKACMTTSRCCMPTPRSVCSGGIGWWRTIVRGSGRKTNCYYRRGWTVTSDSMAATRHLLRDWWIKLTMRLPISCLAG